MTVGLADVSSRIGLSSEQEAEKYIRDMVRRSLYPTDDMLMFSFSFFPTPSLSPFLFPPLFLPLSPQIEDGEIHARLDQVGQMVSFIENPESYDSVVMVQHLDKQLQECMALEKKLTAFDKQLSLEPRYIHRVRVVTTHSPLKIT